MNNMRRSLPTLAALFALSVCTLAGLRSPYPVQSEPEQAPSSPFQGGPISLDLVDVSLVDFFRTISELSGLNILIDPDVEGQITIHVEEIPWDQLFEAVLKSHQLERNIEGNLVRISTKETLQREEEAKESLKRASLLAADTLTITRRLNYATAKDTAETLADQLTLERGQMNVDERTNTLIITDIPDSVRRITGLLDALDVPEKQVEIEARIIEATTNFSRQLGSELDLVVGKITDRFQGVGVVRGG